MTRAPRPFIRRPRCASGPRNTESLAAEAKERGDIEMSMSFAASAAEERMEAQRLEDSLKP